MIQALDIAATDSTPSIKFDGAKNFFEIRGESRPENAQKFYTPVFGWIDQYIADLSSAKPSNKIIFKFYLEYFNSTSSKFLMSLISKIDKIKLLDINVEVQWEYDYQDIDMKEMGIEFSNLVSVPFSFIPVQ